MGSSEEVSIAFVLGNGHSRSVFDVGDLTQKGVTYGCNLLAEEYKLDNAIVCDRSLLVYLASTGIDKRLKLWTRSKWAATISGPTLYSLPAPVADPVNRWDQEIHWGSGTHAINLAAREGASVVVMIGFDLWPREDGKNNIYKDRAPFYIDNEVDPAHWIYQIRKVFDMYPDTSFVQIQPKSWRQPDEWKGVTNYERDTYSGLNNLLKSI